MKALTWSAAALALLTSAAPAHAETGPLRDRASFGSYAKGVPYTTDALKALESPRGLGQRLEIISGFIDWEYVLGDRRDQALARGGRPLLYSWEPHCVQSECISFRDVLEGRQDEYLERVAASMRRYPHTMYVRPWAEMNAHWSPYLPGSDSPRAGSVEEFKQAWRYLHRFFRARGVTNLRFVFNPDASMSEHDLPVEQIWPGQEYVDVLGIDGYNWGESGRSGGNRWQEFEEVFAHSYEVLTRLHPTAPVWICEFGSKEPKKADGSLESPAPPDARHSKAAWIDNLMSSTRFPRIEALVYYNAYTPGQNNQRDFRLESSRESLQAIRRQLKQRRRRGGGRRGWGSSPGG